MPDTRVLSRKAADLLKRDHKTILRLFEEYEGLDAEDTEEKQDLFESLRREIEIHAQVEEEIFYPAVEAADPEAADLVRDARDEHRRVKEALEQLGRMTPGDAAFEEKMDTLCEDVESHVKEEEKEMFPCFRKLPRERQDEISQQLASRKRELTGL